ncbi:MAG: FkbM family methyltransferase [Thermogemmata sp.]
MLQRLWKPWFVYRPTQLLRRAWAGWRSRRGGPLPLRTSWGAEIGADPRRTIGWSILTTGIYDLAVSEVLFRLVSPGDTVVDAGAHVGYMTVLMGVAAGPGGSVLSFEPHPELFAILERNIAEVRSKFIAAAFSCHQAALGERAGTAYLHLPPAFETNDGVARIASETGPGCQSLAVRVTTLDEALGNATVRVLKLDVEGYEPQVLKGSVHALTERRITHIVFEDHSVADSEVVRILNSTGYRLYSLGWSMRGLRIAPIAIGSLATCYEAPSFIATLDPDEVLTRCQQRGWRSLRCQIRRSG